MIARFETDVVYELVTLITVLDPLSTVPVFMAVTHDLNRRDAMKVGAYALGIGFLVLTGFIVMGQLFLDAIAIPMPSFQLAGSFILFIIALKMVLGHLTQEIAAIPKNTTLIARAAFPLGVPMIAGAGSILTVVMLTDNNVRSVAEQAVTTVLVLLCLSVHLISFMFSTTIKKYMGTAGIEITTRVFGLILASLAVHGMIVAIKLSFGLSQV